MANWGPFQILIVLLVILLLFGGKKLPELAHSLGKSLGEFKKGKEEGDSEAAIARANAQALANQALAQQQQLPPAAPAAQAPAPQVPVNPAQKV